MISMNRNLENVDFPGCFILRSRQHVNLLSSKASKMQFCAWGAE